jgi:hypothetical protein
MFRFATAASISVLLALAGAGDAEAQGQPGRVSLQLEGVMFQPQATGSVFDLAASELTLASDDFRHVRPGAEMAIRLYSRLWIMAGWSTGSTEVESSIRRQGTGSQVTRLDLENALLGGITLDLLPGKGAGSWRVSASGGAGQHAYRFEQRGTFPDAARPGSTLTGTFASEGEGTLLFGGLRVERLLTDRIGVSVGARYQWSEAEVGGDFRGFAPISLSGIGVSTGLRFNR